MCNNRMLHITTIRSSLLMFPLTPDQHHWLEVDMEDEGWCSFTSCTPSRSRARTVVSEGLVQSVAAAPADTIGRIRLRRQEWRSTTLAWHISCQSWTTVTWHQPRTLLRLLANWRLRLVYRVHIHSLIANKFSVVSRLLLSVRAQCCSNEEERTLSVMLTLASLFCLLLPLSG